MPEVRTHLLYALACQKRPVNRPTIQQKRPAVIQVAEHVRDLVLHFLVVVLVHLLHDCGLRHILTSQWYIYSLACDTFSLCYIDCAECVFFFFKDIFCTVVVLQHSHKTCENVPQGHSGAAVLGP